MNFLNSIKNKSKNSSDPFKYWEFKEPLTEEMIDEIYNAELDDPTKYDINYDGTRAIDGGEGKFREGITDGGKALKFRCFLDKNNIEIDTSLNKSKYISTLSNSEILIVTSDSISMISEAAITGKPIYIAHLTPIKNDYRFKRFFKLFEDMGIIKSLKNVEKVWTYEKLFESKRIADIIKKEI